MAKDNKEAQKFLKNQTRKDLYNKEQRILSQINQLDYEHAHDEYDLINRDINEYESIFGQNELYFILLDEDIERREERILELEEFLAQKRLQSAKFKKDNGLEFVERIKKG